jgi:hypothetical protein
MSIYGSNPNPIINLFNDGSGTDIMIQDVTNVLHFVSYKEGNTQRVTAT